MVVTHLLLSHPRAAWICHGVMMVNILSTLVSLAWLIYVDFMNAYCTKKIFMTKRITMGDHSPRARHPGMGSQVGLRKHHYEQS